MAFLKIFHHHRVQKHLAPVALVLGFFLDTLTLNRIDQFFDQAVLVIHLLAVGFSIALIWRWYRHGNFWFVNEKNATRLYALMAFSLGGVYSGLTIFYSRSGSWFNSWPLLLVLVLFLVGSEFGKKYFKVLSLQLGAWWLALYLYLLILMPILLADLNWQTFLWASIGWLVIVVFYIWVLKKVGKTNWRRFLVRHGWVALAVLGMVAFSYGFKFMPPVPLSLKFDAVYYQVQRVGTGYQADYQTTSNWQFWQKRSHQLYLQAGDPAYVFTSIFAPNRFSTTIYHEWQFKEGGKWQTTDKIPIKIVGGSDRGYRGYSFKSNLPSNKWRIRTITNDERVIGLTKLKVSRDMDKVKLAQESL